MGVGAEVGRFVELCLRTSSARGFSPRSAPNLKAALQFRDSLLTLMDAMGGELDRILKPARSNLSEGPLP